MSAAHPLLHGDRDPIADPVVGDTWARHRGEITISAVTDSDLTIAGGEVIDRRHFERVAGAWVFLAEGRFEVLRDGTRVWRSL